MSKIKELTELSRYLGKSSDRAYEAIMEDKRFLPRQGQKASFPVYYSDGEKAASEHEEEE